MKRIHLVPPGERLVDDEGKKRIDAGVLRAAAVSIARFCVNGEVGRKVGDPVHEWVTEGRRKQYEDALRRGEAWAQKMTPYSSCGDLGHTLIFCLGCRDEKYVNRDSDGGRTPWKVGVNISRLCSLPAYVDAKTAGARRPKPGDILHIALPDHVCVLEVWDEDGATARTDDYGGPYGHASVKVITKRGSVLLLGKRVLMGWVDIEALELTETALVPDAFLEGTEDENPYPEDISVPPESL